MKSDLQKGGVVSDFSESEVLAHLNKVTSSTDFLAGPRLKKFLTHLVTEELAGRGELLKGTALAMDVFGRGADFDPNNDPIVRIEAVKLRKALDHYYLTGGVADVLTISIPKGQYRPLFEQRTIDASVAKPAIRSSIPSLAIAEFSGSDTPMAQLIRQGLPEEIALEFNRFGQIRVVTGWSDVQTLSAKGINYVLNGTALDSDGHIRLSLRLTRTHDSELIWSERFDLRPSGSDVFDVQEDIARRCAGLLLDAYGAVEEDLNAHYSGRQASDASAYEALLAFHRHLRLDKKESLIEFADFANSSVLDNPTSGLAHALVAISEIEKIALGLASKKDLRIGHEHATQAYSLDPNCQEALFAAAAFSMLNGDKVKFSSLIDRAVKSNTNGSLMIAYSAAWICALGDPERGTELMLTAIEQNPNLPEWTLITLALADILTDNFAEASRKVAHVDAHQNPSNWTVIAAAHILAGQYDLADNAMTKIRSLNGDPKKLMDAFPLPNEINVTLSGAFEKLN